VEREEAWEELTVIDLETVGTSSQNVLVVALVQFTECRQTRSPHPDLELLPGMQVRQLITITPILVLFLPVWWRDNILRLILCLAVQITLVAPRSSLHSHGVILATGICSTRGVGERQLAECVVEHGVGDETAGVVRLACLGVYV